MDARDREAEFGSWYEEFNKKTMKATIIIENDAGEEIVLELPTKWEVCGLCQGKGTHVNPSIDFNGISSEDFDRDPQFEEDYFRGAYDVSCSRCKGRTTEPAVDEKACSEEQKSAWENYENARAEYERERVREIKYGY